MRFLRFPSSPLKSNHRNNETTADEGCIDPNVMELMHSPTKGSQMIDATDILNDIFDSKTFQRMKSKHDKKLLSRINSSDSSPSSTPSNSSKNLNPPPTPGFGIGGSVHLTPINMDDTHVITDILHRITLQNGILPGTSRMISTPPDDLSIANHVGELQYKNLSENQSVKNCIEEIVEAHKEISRIATNVSGYRKQEGSRLQEANKLTMKLFERMLSEVLMMQRNKFRVSDTP
jgi:hypothetical protein